MSSSPRESALAGRHRALGSGLEDWNGMGTAWTYHSDPRLEHDAVREAAGLFDMTPLRKVFIRGRDAAEVVDYTITRDARKITPGTAAYTAVLNDEGRVCDDAIVANNGDGEWMLCHGTGDSMTLLRASAAGREVEIVLDDDLHDLSLQGPKALGILAPHTPLDLESLAYFQHRETELFGYPCRISRTGYSGEQGYEIFAPASAALDIWDSILEVGSRAGAMPCSFTALDKVRVEAALLFFGYDMTGAETPWEVGLGFTVSRSKRDFRGKDAAFGLEGQARFVLAGIEIDHDDALAGGEELHLDGKKVGVLNSPAYSHRMEKSRALVHLDPGAAAPGTQLRVRSGEFEGNAVVARIPFFDPDKIRVRA